MKKKFKLEITQPCQEDFSKMKPTQNGSFCDSCAKTVLDLSNKTNFEIGKIISKTSEKATICARLNTKQLNTTFSTIEPERNNSLKYVATIAASVLLGATMVAQDQTLQETILIQPPYEDIKMGLIDVNRTENSIVSFTLKGKLTNTNTNNSFSQKIYPNLSLSINGVDVKMDRKTGLFEVSMQLNSDTKTISGYLYNDSVSLFKEIIIDLKGIKNDVLIQNIAIDPNDFSKMMLMGEIVIINKEIED